MPDTLDATPTTIFEYLWWQTDRQYSLFDVCEVDWQQVHDSLAPLVSDDMGSDSLFHVCSQMLAALRDGHVNLYSSYDVSHSDSVYRRFYEEGQVDINAVVLGYLGAGYRSTGGIAHNALYDGRVVYMRYSSFSAGISTAQLRHILSLYPDAQGIVLDIRGNGGGSVDNIYNLLGILPSHGQHLYSSQIKSGPAHDDFTAPVPTYAPVVADSLAFHGPVVVLIDRGCFSAASMFALCCRTYPTVTLMGDTTSGGLGLPSVYLLPGGWRYRLPVTRLLTPEGENLERGVPPDLVLHLDREAALTLHRDNLIDSACERIVRAVF